MQFKKISNLLSGMSIVAIMTIAIFSCKEDKKPVTDPKDIGHTSAVKADSTKKATTANTNDAPNLKQDSDSNAKKSDGKHLPEDKESRIKSIMGSCFASITVSEFLAKGAGVYLTNEKNCFDVSELIGYAPDPSQVVVNAKDFDIWCISDFVDKGARIIIPSAEIGQFEVHSLLKSSNHPDRIAIHANSYPCMELSQFIEEGASVMVGKSYEPFQIMTFIDKGKDRVEVDCRSISSKWVLTFLERGGKIRIDDSFKPFHVLQFAKAGKDRVKIGAYGFSIKDLERFLDAGAKILIGKYTSRKPYNSFEISNLIKINSENVTVVADGFTSAEIAQFISEGAKIVFLSCNRSKCDVSELIGGVTPPSKIALSADANKGKPTVKYSAVTNHPYNKDCKCPQCKKHNWKEMKKECEKLHMDYNKDSMHDCNKNKKHDCNKDDKHDCNKNKKHNSRKMNKDCDKYKDSKYPHDKDIEKCPDHKNGSFDEQKDCPKKKMKTFQRKLKFKPSDKNERKNQENNEVLKYMNNEKKSNDGKIIVNAK